MIGAAHLLPSPWLSNGNATAPVKRDQLDAIVSLAPGARLSARSRQSLQAALDAAAPALVEARGLADLSTGRFPVVWTKDGISSLLPHLSKSRDVANLLLADAILESEAGNTNASLRACLAILNAGRSVGDEPALVSQRRRMELGERACRQIERTLAQGEPSAIALATLQTSLDDEDDQPLFAIGIRGDRAAHGPFSLRSRLWRFHAQSAPQRGVRVHIRALLEHRPRPERSTFDLTTAAERIALLPAEEQYTAFQQLETDAKSLPFASRMLVPAILRVATAGLSSRARLRCASAALGCQRYRLVRGTWPSALEVLVPEFLRRRPIDPFDGKPLRFRRDSDQIAIYSVGADRRDDGGRTETAPPSTAGRDLEFRLWDRR